jgi:predicted RNA-binding protein with PUA-like domain
VRARDELARQGRTDTLQLRSTDQRWPDRLDRREESLAQKHLKSIRKGDKVFYYHTGNEKQIVGIARALSDAYQDSKDKTGKLSAFDLGPVKRLRKPVTLAAIKGDGRFTTFPLVKMSRLSVMPVTDAEWKAIEAMSGGEE